jgi:hypothetical protein
MIKFFNSLETDFWDWFKQNEERIFSFEEDQETIFNEVSDKLININQYLIFEFGSVLNDGKRDFIISADGMISAFPAVERLYSRAPALKKWNVIKFRPKRTLSDFLEMGNTNINLDDVFFTVSKSEKPYKVNVILLFKDFKESERNVFGQLTFLLLDHALGEYDTEMKIGFADCESTESTYFKQSQPFKKIQDNFDKLYEETIQNIRN